MRGKDPSTRELGHGAQIRLYRQERRRHGRRAGHRLLHRPRFFRAGANVSIWDYSERGLEHAKAELQGFGKRAHFERVDIGDHASCAAAAKSLPFRLHVLVNNAGITRDKTMAKLAVEDFEAVIRTNLTGSFLVTKALLEQFEPTSDAKRIINMASVVALYGNFGQTNYAAAKAGVVGMTRTLARELGRKGFTVNAIAPGFINTSMTAAMPQELLTSLAGRVPVGRLGQDREVANACLFLASDEASYINGTVLSVDGGLVI